MRILLFGSTGQVGWELRRSLSVLGEVIAPGRAPSADGLCGDLNNLDGLAATIRTVAPAIIVNAAAYTAVDKAETDAANAMRINAEAPARMAQEATALGAWLLHYSTDYVFDGSGSRPWKEDDATGPLSVYGQTKLTGEQAVQSHPRHIILRTSWVYAARGGNFAKTMLRLATERETLNVIADQVGAPTSAELLADISAQVLTNVLHRPAHAGLYHCAANGETSWHGYASYVLEQARALGWALKVPSGAAVHAIPTSSYPTPATRPLNSRLNTQRLRDTFGLHLPPWQHGVLHMLQEISPPPATRSTST
jgi:dTDP-4-dehydrorhamnose reductase